jgi:hypothetical protein
MLDALTIAEVQALRLMLHDFADRQSDQVVKICCCAVDLDLARIVGRQDNRTLGELAASVQQLAKAVQSTRVGDQCEHPNPSPHNPIEQSRIRGFGFDRQNVSRAV